MYQLYFNINVSLLNSIRSIISDLYILIDLIIKKQRALTFSSIIIFRENAKGIAKGG